MKKIFLILAFSTISKLNAQVTISSPENQQWIQYFHHTKFSRKLTNITDIGIRTSDNFSAASQVLFRTALERKIFRKYSAAAGLVLFSIKNSTSQTINFKSIEIRPYLELNKIINNKRFSIIHRIRIEERIYYSLPVSIESNIRIRYKIAFEKPLKIKNTKYLKNKISINAGYEILWQSINGPNTHRILGGLTYKVNKKNKISLFYMLWGNMLSPIVAPHLYIYKNTFWLVITHK